MRIAVEMDQVRPEPVFEMQQPVARTLHVRPAVRHPFEFVVALEEIEISDLTCFFTLAGSERWSHHGKENVDVVSLESTCQFECIGPNAANSIGRHENAFDSVHSVTHRSPL